MLPERPWRQSYCNHCGLPSSRLRLQTPSATVICTCQLDSIRSEPPPPRARPRTPAPTMCGPFRSRMPACPPAAFLAPFRVHQSLPVSHKRVGFDRQKLVTALYGRSTARTEAASKLLLRYTDAGIPKPEMTARINANGFPKLVTRYISRQNKDGTSGGLFIETYRQNSKLAVVTQSFM